jgi:hypothetical protein
MLQGRRVVALSSDTAAIKNSGVASIVTYRKIGLRPD